MNNIVGQIAERDRVLGEFCREAEISYENRNYFSALACLFVVSEQGIKFLLNKENGNFGELLVRAKNKKLISHNEFVFLNILRNFRNKLFHGNHYAIGVEIDGKFFPIDEEETKEIIYKRFADKVFKMILNIIKEH